MTYKFKQETLPTPNNSFEKIEKGKAAELLVQQYLSKLGYRFVTSNFRLKVGEIDLIFERKVGKDKSLVFVEVRSSDGFNPRLKLSITPAKIRKIHKTIYFYLQRNPKYRGWAVQLDVVWVEYLEGRVFIEHLKNVC